MNRIASQHINSMKYSPSRMLLEVQFREDEHTYQYFDVPEEVWYDMKNSASIDMYFNIRVAACYRNKCVKKSKKQ